VRLFSRCFGTGLNLPATHYGSIAPARTIGKVWSAPLPNGGPKGVKPLRRAAHGFKKIAKFTHCWLPGIQTIPNLGSVKIFGKQK
jgi:hypothetical protein